MEEKNFPEMGIKVQNKQDVVMNGYFLLSAKAYGVGRYENFIGQ